MPRRFVSIWFPHLVTDWHTRKQPSLREKPFVLKAMLHNRTLVTAASPLALSQGISPGMVLADAKALCPSLQVMDDKPGLAMQLLSRIAEWCIRFTPVAASDPPDGVLLEATGCVHLWSGEEAYGNDIRKRLETRGYTIRIAIADTIGCAWAMARYGTKACLIESSQQLQAMLSLPVSSLRVDDETVVRLHKLGLRQIASLISMPRSALRRRFAPILLQRLRQAIGEEEEVLVPVYPVEPYQERLPCLEPILTLTGIELALQHLLQALCSRLRKEGKGLRTAFFRCYRVDGAAQGITIGTNRPTHNEEHLFHLFSLKLSVVEPKEGIELFLLEATSVENNEPVQKQLWESAGGMHHPQLAELMDRIAAKLGNASIRRYLPAEHWWPERSYKQATSLNELPVSEWMLHRPRPLQLLTPPECVEVTAPVPDYPPMLFRHKGQLHKIVKADGPERIEQEWWRSEGEHRDYYCVEDEQGRRYWLFRSGHYNNERRPQWYLHGYFA